MYKTTHIEISCILIGTVIICSINNIFGRLPLSKFRPPTVGLSPKNTMKLLHKLTNYWFTQWVGVK